MTTPKQIILTIGNTLDDLVRDVLRRNRRLHAEDLELDDRAYDVAATALKGKWTREELSESLAQASQRPWYEDECAVLRRLVVT